MISISHSDSIHNIDLSDHLSRQIHHNLQTDTVTKYIYCIELVKLRLLKGARAIRLHMDDIVNLKLERTHHVSLAVLTSDPRIRI